MFFKWKMCHENDKKFVKMLKMYRINIFVMDTPYPYKGVLHTPFSTLTVMDGPLMTIA